MARAKTPDPLAPYREKRDFKKTPEPPPKVRRRKGDSFVIQKHAATRTHFDFRLEHDGVLWSWAVTKGPSYDPAQKRLAVRTEDHPLEYGGFEGIIPKGEYGAGPVMIWDRGTWEPLGDPEKGIEDGNLKFILHGERLKGEWALIRMKADKRGSKRENWLLIKKRDEHARDGGEPTEFFLTSVKSGRDMEQIRRGEVPVWSSNRPKQAEEKRHSPVKTLGRAKRLKAPDFIAPQLATTLVDDVPEGADWLHEVKYDGYRIIGRKAGDEVTLFSRRGLDWTRRFPTITEAMKSFPAEVALLDGEIAYVLPDGITDFRSLQEHIDTPDPAIRYFVFDLLWLDGRDLRDLPLVERKARLESLMGEGRATDWIIYSGDVAGSGEAFFREACKTGLEGIISKRKDAPYRSGRSKSWLKIKCGKRSEFVIGGFSKSAANRPFASLLVGTFEDGKLVYAGKVGTGFNTSDRDMLAKRFKAMKRKTSPFVEVPKSEARDAQWIEPRLVCEIAFTEWTRDGRLRHPSFQGLREDKLAHDVHREKAAEDGRTAREEPREEGDAMFAGIALSSPDKVLYPDIGFTKLDLARYYEAVADHMLPFVSDRPISLVRCPEGCQKECFFQRHIMKGMSKAVKEVTVPASRSKRKFIYIDDPAGLFALVQIGVLEIHDWGCTVKRLETPDRVVFDLDPDEGLPFSELKAAAREVRAFLQELGLESFLKVTGGKGLHLVAPIMPKLHWDEVKAFTKAVADALVAVRSDRYTANPLKRTRKDKIFVDYLRNQRGGSAIANYSTRAKAGAPVAVPLSWEELGGLKSAAPYTVKNLPARLRALKTDPWDGFFAAPQPITARARKALGLG